MIKIGISVAMEKRLREGVDPPRLLKELLGVIDHVKETQERSKTGGVGYRDIVSWFRNELGNSLAVPENPGTSFVIRLVNRAREIGLNAETTAAICRGAKRVYPRGPYDIDFLLRGGVRFAAEDCAGSVEQGGKVVTGRPVDD